MKSYCLIFLLVFFAPSAQAQKKLRKGLYSREISMGFDNDIFFLIDYYYTAGLDASYRRLADPHSNLQRIFGDYGSDSSKVIVNYRGGIKIFNPRNIDFPAVSTMDRPYAGWSFIDMSVSNFPRPSVMNRFEAEGGIVGKASGVGQLQRWVHHVLNYEIPTGWKSQIKDEPVINIYYSRYKEFLFYPDLDLISQSVIKAGTGGNKISQDFTFRAFQFNPLSNSVFTQSRTSWDTRPQGKSRKLETFIFAGVGADFVISDIFIQGSLFTNNKSVFTVSPQRLVIRRTYGVMFSSRSISWNITVIHISKEVKAGAGHDYASLGMAVRF